MNLKVKTIKLVEENIGENLSDLGLRKDLLDKIQKVQTTKEKPNKLYIKNFKFCFSK